MQVFKGNIVTVNKNNDVVNYLVENKGMIEFVGNQLPDKYANWPTIDLKDKALIPAFVDTHQHFASFATFNSGLNVMDCSDNQQIMQMISDYYKTSKSKTIIAFGASPYSVKEKVLLNKQQLDEVCPDKEIMVVKYDGHACIINTKLLNKLKNVLSKLRGYHFESGEMNQEAFFAVSNYITNSLSIPQLIKNMQSTIDYLAKRGIGCVNTVSGVGFAGDLDISMEQIFAKGLTNGFQIRVFPQSLDVSVATKRKLPRIGGCFACALDGCFGSMDAAVIQPYTNGDCGVLYYDDEKVIDFCKKANRLNLQIEMHAIGDKAFDQASKALKAALDDYPREDHRHGIIHSCMITEEGLDICKKYHIQLPVQSAFIDWKQEPTEYLESILSKERVKNLNPLKTFIDEGITISFGSDGPCTNPDPIDWLDKAVNNENIEQRISIQQALRCVCYNGYYTTFDEDKRGSLEENKICDMVILSNNPYTIDPKNIRNLKVEQLYLSGKPYQSCKENILKTMVRGLFSKNKA
ncbi:MAG: amidohydrolase family protein [Erysipelotrichaceae bacterium]|nr:amidohydrolase family protein [Erysipelotrichaceae bacterium]